MKDRMIFFCPIIYNMTNYINSITNDSLLSYIENNAIISTSNIANGSITNNKLNLSSPLLLTDILLSFNDRLGIFYNAGAGAGYLIYKDNPLIVQYDTTEVMRFLTSGNLCIGKTTADERLDISGNVKCDIVKIKSFQMENNDAWSNGTIYTNRSNIGQSQFAYINFQACNNINEVYQFGVVAGSNQPNTYFYVGLAGVSSNDLLLNHNGNFMIGRNTSYLSDSYRLNIFGNLRVSGTILCDTLQATGKITVQDFEITRSIKYPSQGTTSTILIYQNPYYVINDQNTTINISSSFDSAHSDYFALTICNYNTTTDYNIKFDSGDAMNLITWYLTDNTLGVISTTNGQMSPDIVHKKAALYIYMIKKDGNNYYVHRNS